MSSSLTASSLKGNGYDWMGSVWLGDNSHGINDT